MEKQSKSHNKFFSQRKYIITGVLAVVLMAILGGVFAKYIHSNEGENLFDAKEFYFTSNLLKETKGEYVLNATSTSVTFTLENHIDKLRFSEDDITYTLSVTCKEEQTPAPTLSVSGGTLKGNELSSVTITLSELQKGNTYTVVATGEAGYEQTLTAEFRVSDQAENVYKHLDTSHSAYVLLTVWTENVAGALYVSCDKAGLIPDNTDPALREIYNYKDGAYQAISFKDSANFTKNYSSYTYRFFVDNPENYTIEDFIITIDGIYIAKKEDLSS